MKFRSAFLCAIAALGILTSCDKENDEVAPALITIDKTVTFEVFGTKDYTTSYFADYEATIRLSIKRGDKITMAETVVFDTTFTKLLKELPMEIDQLLIRKKVPGVVSEKEYIAIGSGFSVGQESYFSSEFLAEEQQELKVEVAL